MQQKQTTEQKHTVLLTYMKAHQNDRDDPLGDTQIFDQEVARYFKVENQKNGKRIRRDKGKPKHSYVVRTHMFGGNAKHLSTQYFKQFSII